MKSLSKNKYVDKVYNKFITYSFEFKNKFLKEDNQGRLSLIVFEEAGLKVETLGMNMCIIKIGIPV
ncbi:hypothetical protein [uncultured Ilyobacter sp.]|uniref:hypothetical protein n=1 Tax=uncultured Ilyobacter sp. TaxID=544433 RepID=UPI002AA67AA0|nr:hypothetical protein [uncultured Ilyobacter sp.]